MAAFYIGVLFIASLLGSVDNSTILGTVITPIILSERILQRHLDRA